MCGASRETPVNPSLPSRARIDTLCPFLLAAILCGTMSLPSFAQEDSGSVRDWTTIRGVNFIPSYSRTAIESWQNYDAEVVDRELGFAKSLGFNGVRAWLHERAYERDPRKFLDHVEDFLTRCEVGQLRCFGTGGCAVVPQLCTQSRGVSSQSGMDARSSACSRQAVDRIGML